MGFADPESKDSNLESTNPGFRDSSLTSPMTSLLGIDEGIVFALPYVDQNTTWD